MITWEGSNSQQKRQRMAGLGNSGRLGVDYDAGGIRTAGHVPEFCTLPVPRTRISISQMGRRLVDNPAPVRPSTSRQKMEPEQLTPTTDTEAYCLADS
jgi:hypothetical protein